MVERRRVVAPSNEVDTNVAPSPVDGDRVVIAVAGRRECETLERRVPIRRVGQRPRECLRHVVYRPAVAVADLQCCHVPDAANVENEVEVGARGGATAEVVRCEPTAPA